MGSFAARCLSEQGMMRAKQALHGNHSTAASLLLLSTCIALEDVPGRQPAQSEAGFHDETPSCRS